jgi:hypothetical protein
MTIDTEKAPSSNAGPVSSEAGSDPTGHTSEDHEASGATEIKPAAYRKLIWKLDTRLLPALFILWFISLFDRVNIGNARLQGLEKDLHMNTRSNQFNNALVILFVSLMIFELPSNWVLYRMPPGLWLCLLTFFLGQYQNEKHFATILT